MLLGEGFTVSLTVLLVLAWCGTFAYTSWYSMGRSTVANLPKFIPLRIVSLLIVEYLPPLRVCVESIGYTTYSLLFFLHTSASVVRTTRYTVVVQRYFCNGVVSCNYI